MSDLGGRDGPLVYALAAVRWLMMSSSTRHFSRNRAGVSDRRALQACPRLDRDGDRNLRETLRCQFELSGRFDGRQPDDFHRGIGPKTFENSSVAGCKSHEPT